MLQLVRLQLKYNVQFWWSCNRKDAIYLEMVQTRSTTVLPALSVLSSEWIGWGLFPGNRTWWTDDLRDFQNYERHTKGR